MGRTEPPPPIKRSLAVIVIADVVGYTRLMERDEGGTHARLREIRAEVIDPRVSEYGGRVEKTAGDGMLVEFASATAALRCAVDVQRELSHRNLHAAPDVRIDFRIGINLGEIIDDGTEIAGDGINVASRLETLADPGGICISSNVYDQVHEDLGFGFIDIGEQQVKNIARPVHAYRVRLGAGPTKEWGKRRFFRNLRWWWVGAGATTVMVLLAVIALLARGDWLKSDSVARSGTAQPPAMSIAVLPFTIDGAKGVEESVAQRLTQDVTTAVAHAPYIFIASYGSVSGYKGKAVDAPAAGRALNVRYVAEGDLRGEGDKIIVGVRMTDAATSRHLSNVRLETTASKLNTNSAAVAGALADQIMRMLFNSEMDRASQQSGTKADAMVLWLRGVSVEDGTADGAREALKLYDESLRLDPKFATALATRTITSGTLIGREPPGPNRDRLIREMDDFSLRAVAADARNPLAWSARATALTFQRRWNEALEALDESSRVDPNRPIAYVIRARIMMAMGRPQDSLAELDKAVAVDPSYNDYSTTLADRCIANSALGRYDDVIHLCERAAVLTVTGNDSIYIFLTAAYAQKGEVAKAQAAKVQLLRIQPGFTIARLQMLLPDEPELRKQFDEHVIAGLRKAGVPEQ
jgi:adenylate cyclase